MGLNRDQCLIKSKEDNGIPDLSRPCDCFLGKSLEIGERRAKTTHWGTWMIDAYLYTYAHTHIYMYMYMYNAVVSSLKLVDIYRTIGFQWLFSHGTEPKIGFKYLLRTSRILHQQSQATRRS